MADSNDFTDLPGLRKERVAVLIEELARAAAQVRFGTRRLIVALSDDSGDVGIEALRGAAQTTAR